MPWQNPNCPDAIFSPARRTPLATALTATPYDGNVFVVLASKARVPNVIGMQPTEATQTLIEAGFTPDPAITTHAADAQDTTAHIPVVTSASVDPGSLVAIGTTITLEYSESLEGWS